ncbi:hypothetical protein FRC09_017903 [Ceratobasidium sp. 395]|nr:hypothetical protein FRC09_017903 [Ceratobasidium sp. 395]
MSNPLHWSEKTHFYPIGNTTPVCLTQDLSPDQSADILLLGCGDPRNILFTLYADLISSSRPRSISFTCCDLEPAVLARNVILFALFEDGEPVDQAWNIFYHFKIDDTTLSLLVRQCQKLLQASESPRAWNDSQYGSFLKFLDARTLAELRRHWTLYAGFPKLPRPILNKLRQQMNEARQPVLEAKNVLNIAALVASRSAGPLLLNAILPVSEELYNYWSTGTMFKRPADIGKAKHINPTFIYSRSGEMFNIHYGTFPQGSHFAPIFASLASKQSGFKMKQQFKAWADAFKDSRNANAITIWLYIGDAFAFCHAFHRYAISGQIASDIRIASWTAGQIHFDQLTEQSQIPKSFDIVDSSNLTDHLGILNILVAAQPLLRDKPASQSVLYTESLLLAGKTLTESLRSRIRTNISTIGLLLGLVPRPYMTGFTTQSHSHEAIMSPETHGNYHERIAWVHPASGDQIFRKINPRLVITTNDLATILADLYAAICPSKKLVWRSFFSRTPAASRDQNLFHYHAETFAMLFKRIQARVAITDGSWTSVALRFLKLARKPTVFAPPRDIQELAFHMYRQATEMDVNSKLDRESSHNMPQFFKRNLQLVTMDDMAVCLVITVPRSSLRILLENPKLKGSVILHCRVIFNKGYATYDAIEATWGRCVTDTSGKVTIQEDPAKSEGNSGLVVTCWVPKVNFHDEDAHVSLGFWPTPFAYMAFSEHLKPTLDFVGFNVRSSRHVRVLPYRPALSGETPQTWLFGSNDARTSSSTSGDTFAQAVVSSGWRKQSRVTSLVAKLPTRSKGATKGKELVTLSLQATPCTTAFYSKGREHSAVYPYPLQGETHKLQLKYRYWEIQAPLAEPFSLGGYGLDPFPILRGDNGIYLWNVHYVNLDRMPILDTEDPSKLGWLPTHINMQLSQHEHNHQLVGAGGKTSIIRTIWSAFKKLLGIGRDQQTQTHNHSVITALKKSIGSMVLGFSGLKDSPKKVFWLKELRSDPFACVLVSGLRLDLTSSTAVLDSAVLCSTNRTESKLHSELRSLAKGSEVITTSPDEALAWKRLLPALAERCRTWVHKPNCNHEFHKYPIQPGGSDDNPCCDCGKGAGFDSPAWDVPDWKPLLPYATRIAISPLFPVPYLEKMLDIKQANSALTTPNQDLFGAISIQKRSYKIIHPRGTGEGHICRTFYPQHSPHFVSCYRMKWDTVGFLT